MPTLRENCRKLLIYWLLEQRKWGGVGLEEARFQTLLWPLGTWVTLGASWMM